MIALQVGFIWEKGLGKSSVDVYTHEHTRTEQHDAGQTLSHYVINCEHVCVTLRKENRVTGTVL